MRSTSTLRRPRRRARPGAGLALVAALAAPSAPAAAPRAATPKPQPAPQDPGEAPFLAPPNNQARTSPSLHAPALGPAYTGGRRFAFTLAPTYASFRMPLIGRPKGRLPGAGLGVEADLQLLRWIWLRVQGSYTGHPVDESGVIDQETGEAVLTAARGAVNTLNGGVGVAVGIDLGRFTPLIDAGVGAFRITTPKGVQQGQLGQPCLDQKSCDVGMVCGGDGLCHVGVLPEIHAGVAIEWNLLRHLALGGTLRYFAPMAAPTTFPIYLVGAIRLTLRY